MKKKREDKERKQYIKAKEREKEITARLRKSLDLHLKACPWCGEEPTIEAEIIPDYKAVGPFTCDDWADPKEYRINLKTCEHLYCSGHYWGTYPIDKIPDVLYFTEHRDYRCDISWNGGKQPCGKKIDDVPFELFPLTFVNDPEGDKRDHMGGYRDRNGGMHYHISDWCRAVRDYFEYLSDDYPYQCCKCHKKWRGYESCGDEVIIDDQSYCTDCAVEERILYIEGDSHRAYPYVIRDGLNIDMMYLQDSPPKYYTSVSSCISCHGLTEKDCYALECIEDNPQGASAWSGSIRGNRWEIWKKNTDPKIHDRSHWNLLGFVFDPPEKDIERYRRLGRKRE